MPRPSRKLDEDNTLTPHPLVHDEDVFYVLCPCGLEFMAADERVPVVRAEAQAHARGCAIAKSWRQGGQVNVRN